ncbi:hypothetical protein HLH26_07175 [Gluconacetobacter sp. 1b LMG 1731]|uniref:Uncharacterized protein n=1 Tax=Gluconacetobacter dulcium TaxID=2729096 RepID=A0A7W4NVE3_9PROT|nr:hypothetical protein [Gluconacetobacter dulcium]MBB2164325.1 hypothetical protein [Gluconacetobacter dulcium]MBB2193605.1 hypothetical protein [Gluconacetobacter dulcium]
MKSASQARTPATDASVWQRAAAHYGRIAEKDRRPGVRLWAALRAKACRRRAQGVTGEMPA